MYSSLCIFSLPAKSHRFSLPLKSRPLESGVSLSTRIWKIVWERDECIFERVCRVILFASPRYKRVKQSYAVVTTYSLYPSTKIPVYLSSLMFNGFLESLS